jgi:glycerol-3-phosphate acyltransferase PlsX
MGGDYAPFEVVQGAVDFARETGRGVLLVGQPDRVRTALAVAEPGRLPVELVPASEVISFGEKVDSIRSKRDSSIRVGLRLVRDGQASGFVSAGHTGAAMALSKLVLGQLDGVDRPALPAPFPRRNGGATVLLDVGANVDCRPEHFRQFAVMGHHYARRIFGAENPRVALLSIGEEDSKGTETLREVSRILRETRINFIGNVEGNDLFHDRADVVVCDGFVGNVALKVAEGVAEAVGAILREETRSGSMISNGISMLGALALRPALTNLKKKMDYEEIGGVPLLGLKGVSIVAHGRSRARAIRSALRVADQAVESRMSELIGGEIEALHQAEKRLAAS